MANVPEKCRLNAGCGKVRRRLLFAALSDGLSAAGLSGFAGA